jgi:methionine-rich copper-binding protein CopC
MSTATFVEQLFAQFMGRSADLGGRDFWTGLIDRGAVSAADVAQIFINSDEYAQHVLPVARLYYAAFGRIPDAAGLAFWVSTERAGQTLNQISSSFMRSAEFTTLYGSNVSDTNFVDLLYKNVLGRLPDAGGKAYWLARLGTDKQSRSTVLTNFSNSQEFINLKNPEIKVVTQYQTWLGTTPTKAQIDAALKLDPTVFTTRILADDAYSGVPVPHLNTKGIVLDGYLGAPLVFIDQNNNHQYDGFEPVAKVNLQGNFSFAGQENFRGVMVAQGGHDITTGQDYSGQFTAPAGSSVITPLTTVLQALLENSDQGAVALQALLAAHLQLDASIDLTHFDPIGSAVKPGATTLQQAAALKVQIRTAQINSIVTASTLFLHEVGLAPEPGHAERVSYQALAQALLNADLPEVTDLTFGATIQAVMSNAARLLQASSEQQTQIDVLGEKVANVVAAINVRLDGVAQSTALGSLSLIGQIQIVALDLDGLIQQAIASNDFTQALAAIEPAALDAAILAALPRLGPVVQDTIAPTLVASTPADNAAPVHAASNITLTFSEAVASGSGNLMITDGTDVRTIAITDASQVSINGSTVTINPTLDLRNGSTYSVKIDKGAITDLLGNPYAGISDTTTLNFTVPAANVLLTGLNGTTGSRYDALVASGMTVASAGDVNGDGYDDFMISASSPGNVGASYLMFGKSTPLTAITKLSTLTGRDGVRLDGVAGGDFAGSSVSGAGDINGDGLADFIIGANGATAGGNKLAGSAYVVFGKTALFSPTLALTTLDGKIGFRLDGAGANNWLGSAVAGAGDVNGDGYDDLLVGANGTDGTAGAAYVVFGKAVGTYTSTMNVSALDGSNGFRLSGVSPADNAGIAVSGAGDLNGDGYADMLVGALGASRGAGAAYVVFGKASGFAANLDLSTLDGSNGVRLDGAAGDNAGRAVAKVGDFNGDGIDDIAIGAFHGNNDTGSVYVVFGKKAAFDAAIDLNALDGSNGFRIDGVAARDLAGFSVASAGDVNGDGLADLLIGARDANTRFGASYLVYGSKTPLPAHFNLADLNGINGFRLSGSADNLAGSSVAGVGDMNGDGYADLLIGAPGGPNPTGSSFLVLGNNASNTITIPGTLAADTLNGTAASEGINGGGGNDTINGGGGGDIIRGGAGDDRISVPDLNFALIDGGGGNKDTLALNGAGLNLNLNAFHGKLMNLEVIDLTGTGDNQLTITPQDIEALSGTSNTVFISGNTGDTVHLTGGVWVDGKVIGSLHDYHIGNIVVKIGTALIIDQI